MSFRLGTQLVIVGVFSILVACSKQNAADSHVKEAWDQGNNPSIFGITSTHYQSVPVTSVVPDDRLGWSGDYWPTFKGGISYRWQLNLSGDTFGPFQYNPLSPQSVASLSDAQLDLLSPSEKYDIYMGRLDFPLTLSEKAAVQAAVVNGQVPQWNGICHGWAAGSTMEPQPGVQTRVTLNNGRKMQFNHGDLQALVSRVYADFSAFSLNFIGGRCDSETVRLDAQGRPLQAECRDVNPGTFHLALGEVIAKRQESFIADISNDEQVWNQPIVGYRLSYSNLRAFSNGDPSASFRAPETSQLVDVGVDAYYVAETRTGFQAQEPAYGTISVSYSLELDHNGFVLGGEWTSESRPDFLWQVRSKPNTSASDLIDYGIVKSLLDASLDGGIVDPNPPVDPNPIPPTAISIQLTRVNIDSRPLRPEASVEGHVSGNGVSYVQFLVTMPRGDELIDQQPIDPQGNFALKGRVAIRRALGFRVVARSPFGAVVGSLDFQ